MSKEGDNSPLISVLMTSYNCEKYIYESIQSILNQTYSNWELLIADDRSTDKTRNIIENFSDSRIKTYHNNKNLHYLRTRNKLIQYVCGEYITLLDADDTCSSNRLEHQLKAFNEDENLALCGSLITYIDKNGNELDIEDSKLLSYEEIKEAIKTKNVFTGSTIMVRTSIWKEFSGYRDYFNTFGYEDYDLTSRIAEKYKVINLPYKLYNYRQHSESFTKNNLLGNPFKLHGYKLVQQFIKQRAYFSQDKLMENDIPWIINFILNENKPYVEDPSLIYRNLTWSSFNRRDTKRAFSYSIKAIFLNPNRLVNYKLFLNLVLIFTKLKNA